MEQKLEALQNHFKEIEHRLSDPAVISQADEYRRLSREHASLAGMVQKYQEYCRVKEELNNLDKLKESADAELRMMAAGEHEELSRRRERLESELKLALLPRDPNDDKDIIVEIRAGTGGDEAALFAGDLFRMYTRYAEKRGWKTELIENHPTGLGGYKEVIFTISGTRVWRHFKFERGIHRVQRVPVTEASGRIHTSAVSVAVLPEAEEVEVELRTEDLRVDTYRASGAGGQHVNKTDSAIRITHIPTGIVVACQDERSQIKNRAKAFRVLRAKLLEKKQADQQQIITNDRRQQVGSGDRSEKIRTYNFPQNRITDHRIDLSLYRLQDVLDGDMEELVAKLIASDQEEKLASAGISSND
ncbi:MAG: peptide chain release factor 1 [Endomicrobiales bacterium]